MAWVSGMLPIRDGALPVTGLVDREVPLGVAREAARLATLNSLAALNQAVGGLDEVERIVRVGVFVASSEKFISQPEVANGASELLIELFGEKGKHARAAVGVARLPLDSPVEVELLVQLRGRPRTSGP
jgi:enamine deaminase RidA (YjgF/YER057c/UK114 family)